MSEVKASPLSNLAMLVGRIIIVAGLIPNGLRKLGDFHQTALGMGGTPQMINGRPFPPPEIEPLINFPFPHFFLACSVTFDILGATLVILGLWARSVAGFLTAYCIMAVAIYHHDLTNPQNFQSVIRTIPMFGGLLYIAAAGAGGFSLDAWLERRRNRGLMHGAAATSASSA